MWKSVFLCAVVVVTLAASTSTFGNALEIKIDRSTGLVSALKDASSMWAPVCADAFSNQAAVTLCTMAGLALPPGSNSMFYQKSNTNMAQGVTGLKCHGAAMNSPFPYDFRNCSVTSFSGACASNQQVSLKCLYNGSDSQNAGGGIYVGIKGNNNNNQYFLRKDSTGQIQLRKVFSYTWQNVCSKGFDAETATAVCQSLMFRVSWAAWSTGSTSNIGYSNMTCGIDAGAASTTPGKTKVLLQGCTGFSNVASCPVGTGATKVNCLAQSQGLNVGGGWRMRIRPNSYVLQAILPGSVDQTFGTACNYKYFTNEMTASAIAYVLGFRNGATATQRKDVSTESQTSDAPILVANISCPSYTPSQFGYCSSVRHPIDPACNTDIPSNHKHDLVLKPHLRGNLTKAIASSGYGQTTIVRRNGSKKAPTVVIIVAVLAGIVVIGGFTVWWCYREKAARDALSEVNTNADGFVRHRNFADSAPTSSPEAHADLMMSVQNAQQQNLNYQPVNV